MRKSSFVLARGANWLVLMALLFLPLGCGESKKAVKAEAAAAESAAKEKEKSDLDRSVEELFAEVCEHKKPMYACDECRYEVGVAKVPKNLLDGGLLKTARVVKHAGESALTLNGEIAFDERKVAGLSPLAPGVVSKVLVDLGQEVKTGQGLVTLTSVDLAAAEAEFLEAESRQALAQKTFERQKALREAGVSAERELLEAEQALASEKIRRDAGHQKLLRFGLSAGDIRSLSAAGLAKASGELILRAPLAGRVLDLHARTGELVSPGEKAVLVGDLKSLWILADLTERDLPEVLKIRADGPVQATAAVQAYPGELFRGNVDVIGSLVDEKTRTVKVRVQLANPDGRLRPGMFARVTLHVAGQKDVYAVPTTAVLADEGRDFVFIRHKDDFFVRRPVVRGAEHDGMTDIVLGLSADQTVVADGAFLLKSDVLRSKMGAGCAD